MSGPLLYSFYGDDFTGSTDVLQQLASQGVRSVLFLRRPTASDLAAFPDAQAIGQAGDSRSRSPAWMDEHLPDILAHLRDLGAPITHYKVCSTFDSSPEIGSIGRAIEIGLQVFPETPFVPIVVAAPHLQRYVAFGNLFAAAPDGHVHRIDRHPMSRHPVTPMREADLRLHLRLQTHIPVDLWDLTMFERQAALPTAHQARAVLFDGVDERTQAQAGKLIWEAAQGGRLFSASSSGLTSALVQVWRDRNLLPTEGLPPVRIEERRPLLVISGSCSVATEQQIRRALRDGFEGVPVDPAAMLHREDGVSYREALVGETARLLEHGHSPILYTALGARAAEDLHGEPLGAALGQVLLSVLERTSLRRVLLCGGDTCSHAVQQLKLTALIWMADAAPGAPLCRAHADDPAVDGLELVLKGGQVGGVDLFERVLHAHMLAPPSARSHAPGPAQIIL